MNKCMWPQHKLTHYLDRSRCGNLYSHTLHPVVTSCHLNRFLQWTLWGHDLSCQHLPRTPDGCEESVSLHPAFLAELPEEYWSLKDHTVTANKNITGFWQLTWCFICFPQNGEKVGFKSVTLLSFPNKSLLQLHQPAANPCNFHNSNDALN